MNNENIDRVESWMFRVPGENLFLILTILILLILSIVLYSFNLYFFLILLTGSLFYIHLQQSQFLGNAIRIHEKQFPDIYSIFKSQALRLGIHRASLYINQDPTLQAFTLGINKCTVVLSSALVEQFSLDELKFVIGHELGHYKAGHTKLSTLVIPVGNGNVFSSFIFGFWNRKSEYSGDRCGLILSKNINTAISALIKLAIGKKLYDKMDINGYVVQIASTDNNSVKYSEMLVDHPLITNRIKNLMEFWKNSFQKR